MQLAAQSAPQDSQDQALRGPDEVLFASPTRNQKSCLFVASKIASRHLHAAGTFALSQNLTERTPWGIARTYAKILHEQLSCRAAWPPITNRFALGDYGLISYGVFVALGNITREFVSRSRQVPRPQGRSSISSRKRPRQCEARLRSRCRSSRARRSMPSCASSSIARTR